MDTPNQPKPENETLLIIRRLAADKQQTQRQMREEFMTNSAIRRAVDELNRRADKLRQAHE